MPMQPSAENPDSRFAALLRQGELMNQTLDLSKLSYKAQWLRRAYHHSTANAADADTLTRGSQSLNYILGPTVLVALVVGRNYAADGRAHGNPIMYHAG